jgi:hypothetical protein
MRKLFLTALGFCFIVQTALATTVSSGNIRHHEYPNVRVSDFLNLSVKELEKLTGQKMNLVTRLSFKLLRAKMKKAVKRDPAITVNEFMNSQKKMKTWLLVLIIVLGAILVAFIIFALAYGGAI